MHPIGQLTHTRRSDGDPDPDGVRKEEDRIIIRHYRNIYLYRQDPIVFLSLAVDTSGCLYHDFIHFLFFHTHREVSDLDHELSEESDRFRFLHSPCLDNLKGSVGLISRRPTPL